MHSSLRAYLLLPLALLLGAGACRGSSASRGSTSSFNIAQLNASAVDLEQLLLSRLLFNTSKAGTGDAAVTLPSLVETARFLHEAPMNLNASFQKVAELSNPVFWRIVDTCANMIAEDKLSEYSVESLAQQLTDMVAQLPNHLCWPIARRVILAAIVQRRILQGPYSATAQAAVVRLCLRLFQLHREAAARKGVVEFFHISKAGGTTFCHLAKANGCKTQSFAARRNCLVREFDDTPRWVNNSLHVALAPPGFRTPWFANWGRGRNPVSCHVRKRFLLRRHYNIYANEYTLFGGARSPHSVHLCPSHLSVLQFRHPHTRLVSHLKWIWALYSYHFTDNVTTFFPSHDTAHWRQLVPAATTNYYIRSLLGEKVYYLPAANVTEHHLGLARLVVTQFDMLMVLEEAQMTNVLYELGLGWRYGIGAVRARTAEEVQDIGKAGLPADLEEMLGANGLDVELYRFSFLLSLLDALVFDVAKAAGAEPAGGRVAAGAEGDLGAAGSALANGTAAGDEGDDVACGYVTLFDEDRPMSDTIRV